VHHWWQFISAWALDPLPCVALVVLAACYLAGVRAVRHSASSAPWPARNTWAFMGGIALLWLAILGPFGSYDDVFFWAHMTQHLLITMLAAPLLVLGSPMLLALRASSPRVRRRWLVPAMRSSAARWLTDPIVTWLLFVIVLMGTHFSPFYEYSLDHPWFHETVEHPLYLTVALLYYYPLLGSGHGPHPVPESLKVLSLASMMVPEAITGFFIYASPYVMYPFYAHVTRPFGPAALVDQQLGGSLMWSSGMLLDAAWLAVAARQWLRADARRTRRLDVTTAREVSRAQIRFL
jgi:cytochrome c oxidase assembly factor CtaG